MDELVTQLLSHIKGIWKYRWYAVATMWVVAIAGWIAVSMLPDRYESSARVYVDTESVLKPLMAGMALPPNLEQQVIIMSRTLISRPNVERVMRMIDLDIRAKTTTDREQLINDLTDDIKIAATGRDNLFTITYENEDPKVAQGVVQSLLTIFVEGSIGDKKDEADSAIRFIDEQIKAYEEKLVAAEIALKQFKQKNMGMMSGQGGDFVSQLSAASDSVNQARLELREAEQSRDAIKSQIANYEPDVAPEKPKARVAPTPEIDARIETLNKNLDAMRLNFTEEHPDVISTKRLIAALEKRKVDEAKLIEPSIESEKSYSPMLQQLNITLADAEARVAAMRARVDEYANRYSRLRSMSYAVPEVEADLAKLNRDYEVNKGNYEQLLSRRDAAKMSGDMSAQTELVSFKVIDPPTAPNIPTGPNRVRLFSLVLLGALASGIGIAFAMSQIRPTFHSLGSLRELTGRPILGSVSMIWTAQEVIKQKRSRYAFGFTLLFLFTLYAMLMTRTILKVAPL